MRVSIGHASRSPGGGEFSHPHGVRFLTYASSGRESTMPAVIRWELSYARRSCGYRSRNAVVGLRRLRAVAVARDEGAHLERPQGQPRLDHAGDLHRLGSDRAVRAVRPCVGQFAGHQPSALAARRLAGSGPQCAHQRAVAGGPPQEARRAAGERDPADSKCGDLRCALRAERAGRDPAAPECAVHGL